MGKKPAAPRPEANPTFFVGAFKFGWIVCALYLCLGHSLFNMYFEDHLKTLFSFSFSLSISTFSFTTSSFLLSYFSSCLLPSLSFDHFSFSLSYLLVPSFLSFPFFRLFHLFFLWMFFKYLFLLFYCCILIFYFNVFFLGSSFVSLHLLFFLLLLLLLSPVLSFPDPYSRPFQSSTSSFFPAHNNTR